jgi:hypothetical protein
LFVLQAGTFSLGFPLLLEYSADVIGSNKHTSATSGHMDDIGVIILPFDWLGFHCPCKVWVCRTSFTVLSRIETIDCGVIDPLGFTFSVFKALVKARVLT